MTKFQYEIVDMGDWQYSEIQLELDRRGKAGWIFNGTIYNNAVFFREDRRVEDCGDCGFDQRELV